MVDSRDKGMRAELKVRDELRALTGLKWERVPASGALSAAHGLKGDLYVPNEKNLFAIEVKHYADDHISSKLLTDKTPQIELWWQQAVRQAAQTEKVPLLIFKFDRSKTFCAIPRDYFDGMLFTKRHLYVGHLDVYLMLLADFITEYEPVFIK